MGDIVNSVTDGLGLTDSGAAADATRRGYAAMQAGQEEGLEYFGGCAVVISHDRWFLDRVATHILAFEGDSRSFWFEGNWRLHKRKRQKIGCEQSDYKQYQKGS